MRSMGLSFLMFVLFAVSATVLSAQELSLKWGSGGATQEVAAEFDRNLKVEITGLNRKDYVYTPEIDLVPGQPTLPASPLGLFRASNRAEVSSEGDDAKALQLCVEAVRGALQKRSTTFGKKALESWYTGVESKIAQCAKTTPPLKDKILSELNPGTDSGQLSLTQLANALRTQPAGPGWTVLIKVKAEFRPQQIDDQGKVTTASAALTDAQIDAGYPDQKDDIRAHLKERVFKINFNPDRRIRLSFGPFVSGLQSRTYDQVANPEEDGAFRIGLTEDSDMGYGIGAFWSVAVWERKKVDWGFSWGVAYTADREIDEAISGLIGFSLSWKDKPFVLHIGAALGVEENPIDGFAIGDAIGADDEIPLTSSLEAAPFVAFGFSF